MTEQRRTWEYRVLNAIADSDGESQLNFHGAAGWELQATLLARERPQVGWSSGRVGTGEPGRPIYGNSHVRLTAIMRRERP